jgi:transposase
MTSAQFLAEYERQQQEKRELAQAGQERLNAGRPDAPAVAVAPGKANAHQAIKLGIDVHLERYVVVRQLDGGAPQPTQRFTPPQFLQWMEKQVGLAEKVYTCYEAGPFGYSLHRQLTALKVTNYVVRPRDWDEYGQKVKTDKRDARELVLNLDRYVGGNTKALCIVRVPSQAEEQSRSRFRQRESLQKEKQRLAAQGRSHALYYGAHLEGQWWVESLWKELVLPPIVMELLQSLRRLIQAIELELKAQTQAIETAAPSELPMGLGKLTSEALEREICDWQRFKNRRQVASYTGMCPREDTSDKRRFQGSINKHGNRRIRPVLVETSWRLIQYQTTYKPVAKWLPILTNPKTTKSKRKQIAVAIGRQFTVDWWRVRTKRCTAEALGLKVKPVLPTPPPTPLPAPAAAAKPSAKSKKGHRAN